MICSIFVQCCCFWSTFLFDAELVSSPVWSNYVIGSSLGRLLLLFSSLHTFFLVSLSSIFPECTAKPVVPLRFGYFGYEVVSFTLVLLLLHPFLEDLLLWRSNWRDIWQLVEKEKSRLGVNWLLGAGISIAFHRHSAELFLCCHSCAFNKMKGNLNVNFKV